MFQKLIRIVAIAGSFSFTGASPHYETSIYECNKEEFKERMCFVELCLSCMDGTVDEMIDSFMETGHVSGYDLESLKMSLDNVRYLIKGCHCECP